MMVNLLGEATRLQ